MRSWPVATTLRERPARQPLHVTVRRASQTVVERDLEARDEVADRLALLAPEPALGTYAALRQARYAEQFAALVAEQ